MGSLQFNRAEMAGVVTMVGSQRRRIEDEQAALGMEDGEIERLKKTMGLGTRHIVAGPVTTSDLCVAAAKRLLAGTSCEPGELDALIFVTQSPDYAAPSSAISMAGRLGMRTDTMCFDICLGCSGFVYGLCNAYSLIQSGFRNVLLCVGDVASRLVSTQDHAITPIMGDAGSAILIQQGQSDSVFQLYSDGSGERALYIPNSGLRHVPEDSGKPSLMQMDGAAVFNFTLKRVPSMMTEILAAAEWNADQADFFVLHQPNKYMLKALQKRMKVPEEKMPSSTQGVYGNQNSASIPGTISGFLFESFSNRALRVVFAGFGIGLSWGACALETKPMFAPETLIFEE